jgi:hypothetical protein
MCSLSSFSNEIIDGRLNSAMLETPFLSLLTSKIKKKHPLISIEIPPPRHWYDIKIHNIPINLKITNGGTDNVFNKKAILYTLIKNENMKIPNSMNFSEWYTHIIKYSSNITTLREPFKEYHFLVIHKKSKNILFKSMLDVIHYKSNPSNILQVNWNAEFEMNYNYNYNSNTNSRIIDILKIIQKSLISEYNSKQLFIHSNIDNLNIGIVNNNTLSDKVYIIKRIKNKINNFNKIKKLNNMKKLKALKKLKLLMKVMKVKKLKRLK